MKTSGKQTVQELKGELKIIIATKETWAIWLRLFDVHNNRDFVNPNTDNTFKIDSKVKIPPILREFFCLAQGLLDLELYRVAQHIDLETPRRTLPYPKIFLRRPKYMKPSTYHMKEWCEYKKKPWPLGR